MPKWTPAEKAIRNFQFWDYGMDEVDPKSEYAEWVPDLAAAVEKAVREQIKVEEMGNQLIEEREGLRYRLIRAEAAVERLTQERDQARLEAAELGGDLVQQDNVLRRAERATVAAREAERQAQAGQAAAEQDAAAARAELAGSVSRVSALEAELFRLRGAVQQQ